MKGLKCMLRAKMWSYSKKTDYILENLEKIYLEFKSIIHPESRFYALLLYSLKYDESNVVSGNEGEDIFLLQTR